MSHISQLFIFLGRRSAEAVGSALWELWRDHGMNAWGLAATVSRHKHNYLIIYSPSTHITVTRMQTHLFQWFCVGCNGVFSLRGVVGVFLVYNDMKRKVIFPPADWNVRHQYSVSQLSDEINAALHPSSPSKQITALQGHYLHCLSLHTPIEMKWNLWQRESLKKSSCSLHNVIRTPSSGGHLDIWATIQNIYLKM